MPATDASHRPKIFSIGFHRTGTRSLHTFLQSLGLNSVHWPTVVDGVSYETRVIPYLRDRRMIVAALAPLIESRDAFNDVPFAALYKELAEAYPSAKFILIRRDVDQWWESVTRHWHLAERGFRSLDPYEYIQYDRYVDGDLKYVTLQHRDILTGAHRSHLKETEAYFADKRDRFLPVDLKDPEIGPKIGGFLGFADAPAYPHETGWKFQRGHSNPA